VGCHRRVLAIADETEKRQDDGEDWTAHDGRDDSDEDDADRAPDALAHGSVVVDGG
jgi:hypothetical protein